jgi:aspartyl/glutamyl-tRNA(Asn/Gln) amidotransferase C subunit
MEEKEFERLLKIARLKLSEREAARIKKDIDEVVRYFDKITRFDASDEPAYQPIHVPTKFRKDRVSRFDDVEMLKSGSKLHNGYIVGPKL